MPEPQKPDDATDKGGDDKNQNQNQDQGNHSTPPADGVNDGQHIPKARFDQVNEKKKEAETALKEIADNLIEEIPEDMRDVIPDLPPAQKIKWLQSAKSKGLFGKQNVQSPDTQRPGGKPPTDLENMTPHSMRSSGYKS